MFVQSNECSSHETHWFRSRFFSYSLYFVLFFFHSAQPYFHTFTCIRKRYSTLFYILAYYLRHTNFVIDIIQHTIYVYAVQLSVYVWGMVDVCLLWFDVSWIETGKSNSRTTQKCLAFSGTDKVNASTLNTYTHTRTHAHIQKYRHTRIPSVRSFNRFRCSTFKIHSRRCRENERETYVYKYSARSHETLLHATIEHQANVKLSFE